MIDVESEESGYIFCFKKNDSFISSCAFNVEEKKVAIVNFFHPSGEKNAQCTVFKVKLC